MKNIDEREKILPNYRQIPENDEIFDPDDNLYNTFENQESLTFTNKMRQKSNNQTFLKNCKKDSNNENL